jgi:hypothetical protein
LFRLEHTLGLERSYRILGICSCEFSYDNRGTDSAGQGFHNWGRSDQVPPSQSLLLDFDENEIVAEKLLGSNFKKSLLVSSIHCGMLVAAGNFGHTYS